MLLLVVATQQQPPPALEQPPRSPYITIASYAVSIINHSPNQSILPLSRDCRVAMKLYTTNYDWVHSFNHAINHTNVIDLA